MQIALLLANPCVRSAGVDQHNFILCGMFMGRYQRSGRNLLCAHH